MAKSTFLVSSSVGFDKHIQACKHHLNQDIKHFTPNPNPFYPFAVDFSCYSQPLANTNLFFVLIVLPFSEYLFFFFFWFFRAASVAYGCSQATGLIRAVATSLRQSHSNTRSELSL